MDQQSYPVEAAEKAPTAGGVLGKGLNRLTRMLAQSVDRQIVAAQIRAYDTSSESSTKPRYS